MELWNKIRVFIEINERWLNMFFDFLQFIVATLIGSALTILISFGLLSYSSNPPIKLMSFLYSDEVMYGVLSSMAGVIMSIMFFYMNNKTNRKLLYIILSLSFLFSLIFSVIALLQTQIGEIFEPNLYKKCINFALISFFISALFYNFDSEITNRKKIKEVQHKAEKYKSIDNGTFNDKKFKL